MTPLERVREAIQSRLQYRPDDAAIIDCMVSVVVAAHHPQITEPVWLYFVGPAGTGKTEPVRTLRGYSHVQMIDELTENSLMSGYTTEEGLDPSLLPSLNGGVLVIKDFTTILDLPSQKRDKIIAVLRASYDGFVAKSGGAAGLREYTVSFGVIACVTDVIDKFLEECQTLGERFLLFRLQRASLSMEERLGDGRKAVVKGAAGKPAWRASMAAEVREGMDKAKQMCLEIPTPQFDVEGHRDIMQLANVLALLRTSPYRGATTKAESPSRIAQQFVCLGWAHMIADCREEWGETEDTLVRRIALDSLEDRRKRIIRSMYLRGKSRPGTNLEYLCKNSHIDHPQLMPLLRQLCFVKAMEVSEGEEEYAMDGKRRKSRGTASYRLTESTYDSIEESRLFT